MPVLGFSFGFGAKDEGLDSAFSEASTSLLALNALMDVQGETADKTTKKWLALGGLALGVMAKMAKSLKNIVMEVGSFYQGTLDLRSGFAGLDAQNLTTDLENQMLQAGKSIAPVLAQMGLMGPAFSEAESEIKSAAYALDGDYQGAANAFKALHEAHLDASDIMGEGAGLKDFLKLSTTTGMEAQQLVDIFQDLNKSWGFGEEGAKDYMNQMLATGQATGVGAVGFLKMNDVIGKMDETWGRLGKGREEIERVSYATVGLAGSFQEVIGSSPEKSFDSAMKVMAKLSDEAVAAHDVMSGIAGSDFGPLLSGLHEIVDVDLASKLIQEDPAQFVAELSKKHGELTAQFGKESFQVKKLEKVLEEIDSGLLFMVQGGDAAVQSINKMQEASAGASGSMKDLAGQGYRTGRSLDESLERSRDRMETSLRSIAGGRGEFVAANARANKMFVENVQEAASDKTWGPWVKRLLRAKTLGIAGLLPMTKYGQTVAGLGSISMDAAVQMAPMLQTFQGLMPVFGKLKNGFNMVSAAIPGPLKLVMAIGGAIYLLIEHGDMLADAFDKIRNKLIDFATSGAEFFESLDGEMMAGHVLEWLIALPETIKNFFSGEEVSDPKKLGMVGAFGRLFGAMGKVIRDFTVTMFEWLPYAVSVTDWGKLTKAVGDKFREVFGKVVSFAGKAVEVAKMLGRGIVTILGKIPWTKVIGFAKKALGFMFEKAVWALSQAGGLAVKVAKAVGGLLARVPWAKVAETVKTYMSGMMSLSFGLLGNAADLAVTLGQQIISIAQKVPWGTIVDTVKGYIAGVIEKATQFADKAADMAMKLGGQLVSLFMSIPWGAVASVVGGYLKTMLMSGVDLAMKAAEIGVKIGTKITEGIQQIDWKGSKDALSENFQTAATEGFGSAMDAKGALPGIGEKMAGWVGGIDFEATAWAIARGLAAGIELAFETAGFIADSMGKMLEAVGQWIDETDFADEAVRLVDEWGSSIRVAMNALPVMIGMALSELDWDTVWESLKILYKFPKKISGFFFKTIYRALKFVSRDLPYAVLEWIWTKGIWPGMKAVGRALIGAGTFLVQKFDQYVIQPVKNFLEKVVNFGAMLWDSFKRGLDVIAGKLEEGGGFLRDKIDEFVIQPVADFLQDRVDFGLMLWDAIKSGFDTVGAKLSEGGAFVKERFIAHVIDPIKFGIDESMDIGSWLLQGIQDGLNAIIDGLKDASRWIAAQFDKYIVTPIADVVWSITSVFSGVFEQIVLFIAGGIDKVVDVINSAMSAVTGVIKDIVAAMGPVGEKLADEAGLYSLLKGVELETDLTAEVKAMGVISPGRMAPREWQAFIEQAAGAGQFKKLFAKMAEEGLSTVQKSEKIRKAFAYVGESSMNDFISAISGAGMWDEMSYLFAKAGEGAAVNLVGGMQKELETGDTGLEPFEKNVPHSEPENRDSPLYGLGESGKAFVRNFVAGMEEESGTFRGSLTGMLPGFMQSDMPRAAGRAAERGAQMADRGGIELLARVMVVEGEKTRVVLGRIEQNTRGGAAGPAAAAMPAGGMITQSSAT